MTPRSSRSHAHESFEELAVGYALHALEPEDELRFVGHLSGCAQCQRAVAEHQETLSQLAYSVPAEEPPPALLEGIRAAIASGSAAQAAAPVAPPGVPDLADARRRRADAVAVRRSWLLSGAAGVMALVLGLGAWNLMLQNDRNEQAARGDRLAQTVEALEQRDARTIQMADYDGRVKAVAITRGQQLSLVVDGLEPNPEGTAYVLWGQSQSGEVRALSTFDVSKEGLDVLHGMLLQVPVEELSTLMVTHEHSRTPPEVTEQPILVAGSV